MSKTKTKHRKPESKRKTSSIRLLIEPTQLRLWHRAAAIETDGNLSLYVRNVVHKASQATIAKAAAKADA